MQEGVSIAAGTFIVLRGRIEKLEAENATLQAEKAALETGNAALEARITFELPALEARNGALQAQLHAQMQAGADVLRRAKENVGRLRKQLEEERRAAHDQRRGLACAAHAGLKAVVKDYSGRTFEAKMSAAAGYTHAGFLKHAKSKPGGKELVEALHAIVYGGESAPTAGTDAKKEAMLACAVASLMAGVDCKWVWDLGRALATMVHDMTSGNRDVVRCLAHIFPMCTFEAVERAMERAMEETPKAAISPQP